MKVGSYPSRWLALLLVAGALALALAPQAASAHGGHDHTSGPASQPADDRTAADPGSGIASPASHGWSPSCPGSPGNACCCGGLTVCTGGAKIALVNAGGWAVLVATPARGLAQTLPGNELLSLLPPSSVLPRAPPFFS